MSPSRCLLASISVILLFSKVFCESPSSTVAVPATQTPPIAAPEDKKGGNPVFQLAGYVRDSVVRTVDGVGLMWKNYNRCNEIRGKQRQHRETLRTQWEDNGVPRAEIKKRLKAVNGGISYDEYAFLIKGKEDRGKLTQLLLLSWGAPKFLPYALMFYPEMLPSPFSPHKDTVSDRETRLEALSRDRSHAVIKTLLNMERDARQVPMLAKLNIFGRKKQQRTMEEMDHFGRVVASFFRTPVSGSSEGVELLLGTLESEIYSDEEYDSKEKSLVSIPKSVVKGLALTIERGNPFDSFLPNFLVRGKVLTHIKKVTESDQFLVAESVDLEDLGTQRLTEACNDRMVNVIGKSNEEMREILAVWLDHAVVRPNARQQESGQYFNGNLARAALMCYNALEATKDEHSASFLPRSLFQGPIEPPQLCAGEKSRGNVLQRITNR